METIQYQRTSIIRAIKDGEVLILSVEKPELIQSVTRDSEFRSTYVNMGVFSRALQYMRDGAELMTIVETEEAEKFLNSYARRSTEH